MNQDNRFKQIEELSLNAWPALQQLVYDGWVVRFAGGHTRRANSINPIYAGVLPAVDQKIDYCMALYDRQNLPAVFKISPFVQPSDLDQRLESRGLERHSVSSVRLRDISEQLPAPADGFRFWPKFSIEWEAHYERLHGVPARREAHRSILSNILAETCFATLAEQGDVVACGLGVLENEHIGLFDIITAPRYRRRGFAQQLISGILHWARHRGANTAYLQVETENTPAINLYAKLGYEEIYQYWYRVKG
ncbi:MAG: GNAT family N-acetyltransferase [Anaerolineae bacterium]|nr:GNAT family N-acetyltransferase [Anaerolineae bacterium]